jgi:hypothetical protein
MAWKMQTGTVLFMILDPINGIPPFLDTQKVPEKVTPIERRRRPRAQVHWPLCFFRQGTTDMVRTTTHDLSSHGFYCIANAEFVPGEIRECTLVVPTHHPNGGKPALPALCRVRVIRVEVLGEGGLHGVGCEIEDFHFVNSAAEHDGHVRLGITNGKVTTVNT